MRHLGPQQATDLRVPDPERQLSSLSLTFGGASPGRRRGLTADLIARGGPGATSGVAARFPREPAHGEARVRGRPEPEREQRDQVVADALAVDHGAGEAVD